MADKLSVLKEYFGYSEFRSGQGEIVDSLLSGRDAVCIMPTGAGKSICYQIPAMLMDGTAIVISPLISLMKDQVNALSRFGIPSACINSSLSMDEINFTMLMAEQGEYKVIYVAPERLETNEFSAICKRIKISMIAVDEAHCVSQWGHDFRPSYLKIAEFISGLNARPVVGAFTATATGEVKDDIVRALKLSSPLVVTTGFDRPNLFFSVIRPESKLQKLNELIGERRDKSGIVYCSTRKNVEEVQEYLSSKGFLATRYHAGLSELERSANQDDFLFDRKTVMVATNAFGMGIDKSNVGYVIHYSMPKSPEAYYQEAGRAGRDGTAADCVLLYCPGDVQTAEYFIDNMTGEGIDFSELAALKKQERKRLNAMVEYCNTSECLRAFLLDYFGEKCESCSGCSNCAAEFREEDITEDAQKIISCVFRLSQRGIKFAAGAICSVLMGGKDKRIEAFNLTSLSTYGIMPGYHKRRISELIDNLVRQGYLERNEEEYRHISITEKGHEAVKNREKITVKVPVKRDVFAEPAVADGQASDISFRSLGGDKPSIFAAVYGAKDEELLKKLKEVRSREAARERLPAYMVFSNAALEDMAVKKPVNDMQFLAVNGVGDVKLSRYGKVFIEAIKEHLESGR